MRKYGLKIATLLLSTVIVFALFPSLRVNADVNYSFDKSTGTLTISGDGEISSSSVSRAVFGGMSELKVVKIEEGVTSIGDEAFVNCYCLTSIEIPTSVTSIGDSALFNCSSLTSIEIPISVTSIGDKAFYGCSSLTSIEIPTSVTSIANNVFYGCSSLTSIEIPNSVTSIGDSALFDCSSLTVIEIPSSVTSIGAFAFAGCSGLTSIEIPSSITSIDEAAFLGCSSVTSIEIPSSVTSIGNKAFVGCSSLKSIEIPTSVTSIGDSAFERCSSLTSIEIPSSVTSIGTYAFSRCSSLTNIEIPSSVTSIGAYVFMYSGLTEITIPAGVTSIGVSAFSGCKSLRNVVMPKIDDCADSAFSGCSEDLKIRYYCKITFENVDGTELQEVSFVQGDIPTYSGETPTREADAEFTYEFGGWTDGKETYLLTDKLPVVTDDVIYTAYFVGTKRSYTVKFTDESGKELQSTEFNYGASPEYKEATPSKADTDKYTYTFAGWTDGTKTYGPKDTLPAVTGAATYKAVFTEEVKSADNEESEIKPDEQKSGVYYLNSMTGDGVTSDIVISIKRTEDDEHCIDYFSGAEVDGKAVTAGQQIEVTAGSTVITIKKDFLATLGEGTHTLKVSFNDGETFTVNFVVKAGANNAASVPSTGERISYYAIAGLMLAGAGVIVFGMSRKKRMTNK